MGKCLIQCPHCGHQANAKEELIGKKTRCPQCQRIFTIERAEVPEETPPKMQEGVKEEEEEVAGVCPSCNSDITLLRSQLGQELECPYCKETIVVETEKIVEYHCPFCGQVIKEDAEVCKYCHKSINLVTKSTAAWGKPLILCWIGFVLFWLLFGIQEIVQNYLHLKLDVTTILRLQTIISFLPTMIVIAKLSKKFKPGLHSSSPGLNKKGRNTILLLMGLIGLLGTFSWAFLGLPVIFLTALLLTAERAYLPFLEKMSPGLFEKWTAAEKPKTKTNLLFVLFPTFAKWTAAEKTQKSTESGTPARKIRWIKPLILVVIAPVLFLLLSGIFAIIVAGNEVMNQCFKIVFGKYAIAAITIIAFLLIMIFISAVSPKFASSVHPEDPKLSKKERTIIMLSMLAAGCLGIFVLPLLGFMAVCLTAFLLTAEVIYLPLIRRNKKPAGENPEPPAVQNQAGGDQPLRAHCPYCGTSFKIQEEWIGQTAECAECHKEFVIK